MDYICFQRRVINSIKKQLFREKTVLRIGKELKVDTVSLNKIDNNYGDWFVHPCVRYIKEGFAGHKWYMAVTPYPHSNSRYENPVLYYGDSNTEEPPMNWVLIDVVCNTHRSGGYNADCNIFFLKDKLWIIWKENDTENTIEQYGNRVIMGCCYDGVRFSVPIVMAHNFDCNSMYLASPVLCTINNELKMLGVFSPVIGDNCPGRIKKPRSIAVYGIKDKMIEKGSFSFEKIVAQQYPKGFDFWHIDCFNDSNGKFYCLVTPESGNQILLGESIDGTMFRFFKLPLLHANGKDRVTYMYKSSGVLIGNRFHLFYPHKVSEDKVHIFCTSINFDELLNELKQNDEQESK